MDEVFAHPPLPNAARLTIVTHPHPSPAQALLEELLTSSVILPEDWESLPPGTREALHQCHDRPTLLQELEGLGLLTCYQVNRLRAGELFGLVLGNYRVLERLGAGGMGVVYRAEHVVLRRPVAVKVLSATGERDLHMLFRFYAEMRTVAHLQHPNIVAAIDAGQVASDLSGPTLHYFVMEYVAGHDLEQYVRAHGPLPIAKACDLIHQAASALAEAHRHNLVHRDVKPSNLRVTAEGQVKLLDFGLTRHLCHRLTHVGTCMGTLDYIAPEQVRDSACVDIRADIYSLGATLFWCLTGRTPFPPLAHPVQGLAHRQGQPPPSVRAVRPDVPVELDALVARMMAVAPEDRFDTPTGVSRALLPFLAAERREQVLLSSREGSRERLTAMPSEASAATARVLVVDDDPSVRSLCRQMLQSEWLQCDEVPGGAEALEAVRAVPYDLVLLDIDMPAPLGPEVCRHLRLDPPTPNLKIVMFSGRSTPEELAHTLAVGADSYLTKPFSMAQLTGHVHAALRMKRAQDRADQLMQRLLVLNQRLEQELQAHAGDLAHARSALVFGLARIVEQRSDESAGHLQRLQKYCRRLAEEAAANPLLAAQVDAGFLELLEWCVPLHDIGKACLPDHILNKPGKLDADERLIMQAHTTLGADTLRDLAQRHGQALTFLPLALAVTRHHHERYDGGGYPDQLAGDAIPLAARIVSLCDAYDALRCRRAYRPALTHAAARDIIAAGSPGQFDPLLVSAFLRCAEHFDQVFRQLPERGPLR